MQILPETLKTFETHFATYNLRRLGPVFMIECGVEYEGYSSYYFSDEKSAEKAFEQIKKSRANLFDGIEFDHHEVADKNNTESASRKWYTERQRRQGSRTSD